MCPQSSGDEKVDAVLFLHRLAAVCDKEHWVQDGNINPRMSIPAAINIIGICLPGDKAAININRLNACLFQI